MGPRSWILTLALGLGAVALGACQSAPTATVAAQAEASGFVAPMLTPQQEQAAVHNGQAINVYDARPATPYAAEHVQGAINLPDADLAMLAPQLPHDRLLLIYCTCVDEGLSLKVAGELHDQYGFTQVAVIKGGLAAWKSAGLTTEGSAVSAPSPSPSPSP